jgi:transposase-like protein
MQFKTLPQALAFFQDEDTCHKIYEQMRFPDGVIVCPKCGQRGAYRYATTRAYKCKSKTCKAKFSITVGTVLENTKLPLGKWFAALYLISSRKKGISSLQLARDLGIGNKAAWFMLQRLRELLEDNAPEWLDMFVECDEVYVGGKWKNRSHSKRKERKERKEAGYISDDTKTPVMGMLQRDGKAILRVMDGTTEETMKGIIRENVSPESVIITDSHTSYVGLDKEFAGHEVVNHSQGEYVRGDIFTNSVEGFFSHLKRMIFGTYHSVSRKHLARYCNECSYRFNTRKLKDGERFALLLANTNGRLKYKDLIKKY